MQPRGCLNLRSTGGCARQGWPRAPGRAGAGLGGRAWWEDSLLHSARLERDGLFLGSFAVSSALGTTGWRAAGPGPPGRSGSGPFPGPPWRRIRWCPK
jgi:hypothetical protein